MDNPDEAKKFVVRCVDRMVFEVNRTTLEPKGCSYYDAYCFTHPRPDVDYMEYSDWCNARSKQGWGI